MTAQQVAADLRAAAEVLRRDGWTQHHYFSGRRCCVSGALMKVVGMPEPEFGTPNYDRAMRAASFLSREMDVPAAHVWNDAPGRTADEVIAALEAAADSAEAQQ